MRKPLVIVVLGIIIIILILSLTAYAWVKPVNSFFNSFKYVDKTCVIDSDCKMGPVNCAYCQYNYKLESVNKNYKPLCPIPYVSAGCRLGIPEGLGYSPRCQDNLCVYVIPDIYKE